MKLYSMAPSDCSGKVRWLLHELGLPFEDIKLSWKAGDLKTDEYLRKNPIGQVPVFEDDNGITLYESYAIVAYLADKYPAKGLAPNFTSLDERALYYQWLFFSTNTAEDFFGRYFSLAQRTEEYKQQWASYIEEKVRMILGAVERQLEDREYIMGSFSAVDACLGYALDTVCEESFFSDFPKTKAYYQRLADRQACKESKIFQR